LPAEAVGRIYQKLVEEMRNWELLHSMPLHRNPPANRRLKAAANKEGP